MTTGPISAGMWDDIREFLETELQTAEEAWTEYASFVSGEAGKTYLSRPTILAQLTAPEWQPVCALFALSRWLQLAGPDSATAFAEHIGEATSSRVFLSILIRDAVAATWNEMIYDRQIANNVEGICRDGSSALTMRILKDAYAKWRSSGPKIEQSGHTAYAIAMPRSKLLPATALVEALGLPEDSTSKVESYLRRFAETTPACRRSIENKRQDESLYVYRVDVVWPTLIDMLPRWK